MCTNLVSNERCKLKLADEYGRKYVQVAVEINRAFSNLASSRATKEEAPLGVGCGGPQCCFISGKYAELEECPYFNVRL